MTLDKICDRLFDAKRIAIFTHISPDCDGIGAMFALYLGLKQLKKKCHMFVDGQLNKYESQIFEIEKLNAEELNPNKYDTFISLDCADLKRLGKYSKVFSEFDNTYKIDHHINCDNYAKNSYVEHDSASCCEIVYEMLTKLHVSINKDIATCLYAGIATDTNSFLNTNTTARSYVVAEKLFMYGADTQKINKLCFRTVSKQRVELIKLFYNKIRYINDNVAYVLINQKDFKKTGSTTYDTADFSNLLCSIDGVKIGCCISEKEPKVFSFSFRSLPGYDVNALAQKFGGGGHLQAAGAKIDGKEKDVEKTFLRNVKEYIKSI